MVGAALTVKAARAVVRPPSGLMTVTLRAPVVAFEATDRLTVSSTTFTRVTALVPRSLQLVFADYLQPDPRGNAAGESPALRLEPPRPNPFSGCTAAGFTLPAAAAVQWRVLDAGGREWFRREGAGVPGYQEETICLDEAAPPGVYFCQLITPFGTSVRKIQIVK